MPSSANIFAGNTNRKTVRAKIIFLMLFSFEFSYKITEFPDVLKYSEVLK